MAGRVTRARRNRSRGLAAGSGEIVVRVAVARFDRTDRSLRLKVCNLATAGANVPW
jgi:hypothetical protein